VDAACIRYRPSAVAPLCLLPALPPRWHAAPPPPPATPAACRSSRATAASALPPTYHCLFCHCVNDTTRASHFAAATTSLPTCPHCGLPPLLVHFTGVLLLHGTARAGPAALPAAALYHAPPLAHALPRSCCNRYRYLPHTRRYSLGRPAYGRFLSPSVPSHLSGGMDILPATLPATTCP